MAQHAENPRDAAVQIIQRLRAQGHTAYLAGGCVRDSLLEQTPKDYDVATDATPQQVQALFPASAAVGAAFGVVLVYTPATKGRPRWNTEVATFRAEGAYSDGRHPDAVRFTTADQDAQRRDFTINGLFAQPPTQDGPDHQPDTIIDYVNGQADLEAKVIRAIGDPGERFGEDYLRMLRAVRFAARLGFEIEAKTSAAIRAHARYLGQISRERIGQELNAMLAGPRPLLALQLLQQHKLDAPTLNEDPNDAELTVSQALHETDAEVPTRLAAWMIDRHGRAANHERTLTRWRRALSMSNDARDEINRLMNVLPRLEGWASLGTAQRKRLAAEPHWGQSLLLLQAVGADASAVRAHALALADDGIGLSPKPLFSGDDLIGMGMQPGPAFKTVLDRAYDLQLEGELKDREQALDWLGQQARH